MNYFKNCKSIEEVKALFKKLVFELHPDTSKKDTSKEFITMKEQYETAAKRLRNVHTNAKGDTYTEENTEDFSQYAEIIEKLVKMNLVNVEICGSWIWITGNTYEYKNEIKEMGFKWANNKKAWYFTSEPFSKKSKKTLSLDEIRERHGSKKFENIKIVAIG